MTVGELKFKASLKQAAFDSCPGHLWNYDHRSQIVSVGGDSEVCVICGMRRVFTGVRDEDEVSP